MGLQKPFQLKWENDNFHQGCCAMECEKRSFVGKKPNFFIIFFYSLWAVKQLRSSEGSQLQPKTARVQPTSR